MEIIKYCGFKDKFFGLGKEENDYYIITMSVANVKLNVDKKKACIVYRDNPVAQYDTEIKCSVDIVPKVLENNSYIKVIKINNEKEYDTILSIMETIL